MITNAELHHKLELAFQATLTNPGILMFSGVWGNADPGLFNPVLVTVISASFEGMDESKRQEKVWDCLLADFDEDERGRIEFVFTKAPSEFATDDARKVGVGTNAHSETGHPG